MHSPNLCPQCSAQLPPAAPRCGFCGFATPWGATLAAQQAQLAALKAERERRLRIEKATSTARTGMILALASLPICCGPLSENAATETIKRAAPDLRLGYKVLE